MSAGTAYSKRYGGGFLDKPTLTTPIDAQFLNAVETALLQLIGSAPTADAQVMQWDNANTRFGPALLLNKNIDPAAAISKSKLDFTGANGIVDADVAGAAGIQRSKLNFGSGLVNADIAAAAAIAASKIAGYPTDGTKALLGDGTWARQVFKKTTQKNVGSSITQTDLLNGEITIPILTATSSVRIRAWGIMVNATGVAQALPSFALILGGTTLVSISGAVGNIWNSGGATSGWIIDAHINNDAATNLQHVYMEWRSTFAGGSGAATNSAGGYTYSPAAIGGVSTVAGIAAANSAVDTTAARLLQIGVTNAVNSGSYATALNGALVEVS